MPLNDPNLIALMCILDKVDGMHEAALAANDPDEIRALTEKARRHLSHLKGEVRKAVQDDLLLMLSDRDDEGTSPKA